MRLIDRVLIIFSAYLAAGVVASVALALAMAMKGGSIETLLVLALMFGTFLVVQYAAVPAALVITFAESARVRSPIFYAAMGCLTGIITVGVYFFFPSIGGDYRSPTASPPIRFAEAVGWLVACGASGLIAGLIYWRIAGRHAGVWRDQQDG